MDAETIDPGTPSPGSPEVRNIIGEPIGVAGTHSSRMLSFADAAAYLENWL